MSVDKIKQASYKYMDESPTIEIELKKSYTPHLIETSFCDRILIYWESNASPHDQAITILAVEEVPGSSPIVEQVQSYHDFDLKKAMRYVTEELKY